jgi:hypothetical protein
VSGSSGQPCSADQHGPDLWVVLSFGGWFGLKVDDPLAVARTYEQARARKNGRCVKYVPESLLLAERQQVIRLQAEVARLRASDRSTASEGAER